MNSSYKASRICVLFKQKYPPKKSYYSGVVRGVSRKQLILNCKNVKTYNLQLEKPLKNTDEGF